MKKENRVEEVLNSVKTIQRASVPHDGFQKIQQRLADQRKQAVPIRQQSPTGWLKIAAVVALVVSTNLWAVYNYYASGQMMPADASSYAQITNDFNLYTYE